MEFEMTNTQAQDNPSPAMVMPAPVMPSLAARMAMTAGLTIFAYAALTATLSVANAIDRSTWFGKVKNKFKKQPMKISPEAAVAVDSELARLRSENAKKDAQLLDADMALKTKDDQISSLDAELKKNNEDFDKLQEQLSAQTAKA